MTIVCSVTNLLNIAQIPQLLVHQRVASNKLASHDDADAHSESRGALCSHHLDVCAQKPHILLAGANRLDASPSPSKHPILLQELSGNRVERPGLLGSVHPFKLLRAKEWRAKHVPFFSFTRRVHLTQCLILYISFHVSHQSADILFICHFEQL